MNKIQVNYTSCWDGCEDIETDAILDLNTGIVSDIEAVDVSEEYEICIGEFIKYKDGTIEEVIEEKNCYKIVSKTSENYSNIKVNNMNFIVSDEIDKKDICKLFRIYENN